MAYGVTNILGALLGGLPTATYSQNVGIVTTTKVINRWVLGLAAAILGVAGIVPKFSALLTTIPQCVLGGATVSVFASIAMTGMKLVASAEMDYRNSSIVGLAAAIGVGVSQASAALASFPDWVTTIFGKSPVVLATLIAVVLNIILPKSRDEKKHEKELKKVVACGCDIIGINNRNLKTFDVDLNTTSKLAPLIPYEAVLVSESGMKDENDMKNVKEQGADAVLIGETFMRSDNIKETMKQLRSCL